MIHFPEETNEHSCSSHSAAKVIKLQHVCLHSSAVFHCNHVHKEPFVLLHLSFPLPNNTVAQNQSNEHFFFLSCFLQLVAFVFNCFQPPPLSLSVESWGLLSPSPQREPSVSQARTLSIQQLMGGRLSVWSCLLKRGSMSTPCWTHTSLVCYSWIHLSQDPAPLNSQTSQFQTCMNCCMCKIVISAINRHTVWIFSLTWWNLCSSTLVF